jgi:hypothetical protein
MSIFCFWLCRIRVQDRERHYAQRGLTDVDLRIPDAQLRVLPGTAMPMQRQLVNFPAFGRHLPFCSSVWARQMQCQSSALHTTQI